MSHHRVGPILKILGLLDVPACLATGLVGFGARDVVIDEDSTLQVLLVLLGHHRDVVDRLLMDYFLGFRHHNQVFLFIPLIRRQPLHQSMALPRRRCSAASILDQFVRVGPLAIFTNRPKLFRRLRRPFSQSRIEG